MKQAMWDQPCNDEKLRHTATLKLILLKDLEMKLETFIKVKILWYMGCTGFGTP